MKQTDNDNEEAETEAMITPIVQMQYEKKE